MTLLLLVGCGKMGGALLDGWMKAGSASQIVVVEPAALLGPPQPAVHRLDDPADLPPDLHPDVVVLAVKPQMMDGAIPHYRRFAEARSLTLSIAAGRSLSYFSRMLGAGAPVVRAMPNTPAAIGQGMSVLVANDRASPSHRDLAQRLMAAVGATEWIEDEALLDPVTALSGSGPAYVFLLIEAMAEAGRKAGLPAALAMRLARRTVEGAGALAAAAPDEAATLRRNVTSPKGTTEAALGVLMADTGLQPLMDAAIAAAAARSRELAG